MRLLYYPPFLSFWLEILVEKRNVEVGEDIGIGKGGGQRFPFVYSLSPRTSTPGMGTACLNPIGEN